MGVDSPPRWRSERTEFSWELACGPRAKRLRTRVPDIARGLAWPAEFTARARKNAFIDRWEGREDELAASAATIGPAYRQAWMDGDADNAGVFFGEAAGLIHEVEPAATIIERVVADADRTLKATAASCR